MYNVYERGTEMKELDFYEEIGNWDFSQIKYKVERVTDWNMYEEIAKCTNEKSICLDLGTGGGENLLKNYPNVGLVIGTDFSSSMIETARKNAINYPNKNVRFVQMDNLHMVFPYDLFDVVSARHTIINATEIYDCLNVNGFLIIEGVDQKDCWELKELFKRGQAYNDEIAISEKDYQDIKNAGFSNIQRVEIIENEYYETKEDLLALLLKTPILEDFSELVPNENLEHKNYIEMDLLDKYIAKNTTEKGIFLKRVLYGIVAKK